MEKARLAFSVRSLLVHGTGLSVGQCCKASQVSKHFIAEDERSVVIAWGFWMSCFLSEQLTLKMSLSRRLRLSYHGAGKWGNSKQTKYSMTD